MEADDHLNEEKIENAQSAIKSVEGFMEKLESACQDIVKKVKEMEESKYWVECSKDPCLRHKMDIGELVAAKGTHIVPFSMEDVIEFLRHEESLKKLNWQLIEIKVLFEQQVTKVLYMQFKGVWPVANRDFVTVAHAHRVSEDKVFIGTKSIDFFPCPQVAGVVRGEVILGAYILERVDATHTKVVYISNSDIKGWIPNMMKNPLSQLQGTIAFKVEEVMKREVTKKEKEKENGKF